ncbi:MAG: hypothetical protein KKF58_04295 [Gammaproteobacteria bacterium]|nr:hypothetical protein [Gammaproteobacteria bacterium]MBU1447511.1 hypothetical protein [Gammaproteobacteria bacterium]MDD2929261.1 hypothetical protein [Sideroxydans sp.]
MNRKQRITLWVGVCNVIFLLLFPPFDSLSVTGENALIFAGFNFIFANTANEVVNTDVLFLEMVVVVINIAIAWLLFNDRGPGEVRKRRFNIQNVILVGVAINLILILLFPPFENVFEVSRAIVPSFQGFYFIFAAEPLHAIIVPVLYEEVVFVIINGTLLWFFFRPERTKDLTPAEAIALMRKLSKK